MQIVQVCKSTRGFPLRHKTMGLIGNHGGYHVYEFGIKVYQRTGEVSAVTFPRLGVTDRYEYSVDNEEITILGDIDV